MAVRKPTSIETLVVLNQAGDGYEIPTSGGESLGSEYNATPPTLADGEASRQQLDENGNTKVTLATGLNPTDDQVALGASTTGGATPYKLVSAATTNATSVKGSAGTLYMITASNVNADERYLKLYNKATSPTVGTDTPVHTFIIPGNAAGAGTNIPVPAVGLAFSTGIAFALTTEATDAGTTGVAANEIVINLAYK